MQSGRTASRTSLANGTEAVGDARKSQLAASTLQPSTRNLAASRPSNPTTAVFPTPSFTSPSTKPRRHSSAPEYTHVGFKKRNPGPSPTAGCNRQPIPQRVEHGIMPTINCLAFVSVGNTAQHLEHTV